MTSRLSHDQRIIWVEQALTVGASAAYAAGDAITGAGNAAFEINIAGFPTGFKNAGAVLQSVMLVDQAKQSAAIDILLFGENPSATTPTDNAALDVADADLLKLVAAVSVTTWFALGDNSVGQAGQLGLPFVVGATPSLWAIPVSRGTPTFAATTDLALRLGILLG